MALRNGLKEALPVEERPIEKLYKRQRTLPDEEAAPEGVPTLTLFHQYEDPKRQGYVEAPPRNERADRVLR